MKVDVGSWSLRTVEQIEALGLLPSGHLVQAMTLNNDVDGELDEEMNRWK